MIKIGVSACLLGQNVRYDGRNKAIDINDHFDPKKYQLIGICPEVEMGLSIPRPPIKLIKDGEIKLVQVDDHSIDLTHQMRNWFQTNFQELSQFSGFILKSKSPSCGIQSTLIISKNQTKKTDGLFVRFLKQDKSSIVLIDEINIQNNGLRNQFMKNLLIREKF
jgi:uncharacterized protein YbbK (DUF523 family)